MEGDQNINPEIQLPNVALSENMNPIALDESSGSIENTKEINIEMSKIELENLQIEETLPINIEEIGNIQSYVQDSSYETSKIKTTVENTIKMSSLHYTQQVKCEQSLNEIDPGTNSDNVNVEEECVTQFAVSTKINITDEDLDNINYTSENTSLQVDQLSFEQVLNRIKDDSEINKRQNIYSHHEDSHYIAQEPLLIYDAIQSSNAIQTCEINEVIYVDGQHQEVCSSENFHLGVTNAQNTEQEICNFDDTSELSKTFPLSESISISNESSSRQNINIDSFVERGISDLGKFNPYVDDLSSASHKQNISKEICISPEHLINEDNLSFGVISYEVMEQESIEKSYEIVQQDLSEIIDKKTIEIPQTCETTDHIPSEYFDSLEIRSTIGELEIISAPDKNEYEIGLGANSFNELKNTEQFQIHNLSELNTETIKHESVSEFPSTVSILSVSSHTDYNEIILSTMDHTQVVQQDKIESVKSDELFASNANVKIEENQIINSDRTILSQQPREVCMDLQNHYTKMSSCSEPPKSCIDFQSNKNSEKSFVNQPNGIFTEAGMMKIFSNNADANTLQNNSQINFKNTSNNIIEQNVLFDENLNSEFNLANVLPSEVSPYFNDIKAVNTKYVPVEIKQEDNMKEDINEDKVTIFESLENKESIESVKLNKDERFSSNQRSIETLSVGDIQNNDEDKIKVSMPKEELIDDFDSRYASIVARLLPNSKMLYRRNYLPKGGTLDRHTTAASPCLIARKRSPELVKSKSATLDQRLMLRPVQREPKLTVNDDYLFPDSITPSKVERSLSPQGSEHEYNVPYMDDDAFLPHKIKYLEDADSITYSDFSEDEKQIAQNNFENKDIFGSVKMTSITPKNGKSEAFLSKCKKSFNLCSCVRRKRS